MLEAKHQGHKRKRSPQKVFKIFFQAISKNRKVFKIFFHVISTKNGLEKNFSCNPQNFNHSRKCCPRPEDRVIFEDLKLRRQGLDLRGQGLQNMSSRTPPLLSRDSFLPNMSINSSLFLRSHSFTPHNTRIISLSVLFKIAISFSLKHHASLPYNIADFTQLL